MTNEEKENLMTYPKELLVKEIERLYHNESLNEDNNQQFDLWIDEFLVANGLEKYVQPLHNFLAEKVSED